MDTDGLPLVGRHREVLEALGDREPSTALEVQAVLEGIRAEKGYLDEETLQDLNSIPARSRDTILHAFERMRVVEAAYTRNIASELYSSQYRFLYELVQNADDCRYSNARRNNSEPYLRFRLTRRTFTIETNEDGFTRANIRAICETGRSSHTTSEVDDSIGEHGFGFKSVFAIAEEVHIQSGIWSFRFKHRSGDDGLGMITPLDASPESLPGDVVTRMTLTLSEATRQQYQRLLDAVAELPDTTTFFLRNLREFEIYTMEPTASPPVRKVIRKRPGTTDGTFRIIRTVARLDLSETEETDESIYLVFAYNCDAMPEDRHRSGRRTTRVQLAFPVDSENRQPKLSDLGQYVFAYLPLQRIPQMPFLIQADFVTSANRESVLDCAWNDAIRDGVASSFTTAIATFAASTHPLRYSWLDYLPRRPMDGLWRHLYGLIKVRLQRMQVLQTWEGRQFKQPSLLRRLLPVHLHNAQPIFKDLADEIYLAPEYDLRHERALDDLGVQNVAWPQLVDRLQADLLRIPSTLRTRSPDNPWHDSCATALLALLQERDLQLQQTRIKRLAIIPLRGGTSWTGAPGIGAGGVDRLYFPTTDGIPIPTDVSLHLVETVAASRHRRRELFRTLGVEDCPRETVFSQIEATHRASTVRIVSEPHFKYLFNFHPLPELLKPWIWVLTENGFLYQTSVPLYFLSPREYDTQNILPDSFRTGSSNDVAKFIHRRLQDLESPEVRRQNMTWKVWLQRATGARDHPPLVQIGDLFRYEMSKVLQAVIEHNPEKFVGTLRAHWTEYRIHAHLIITQLKETNVPCETGALQQLQVTYLPTAEARTKLRSLNAENGFPLLKLPSPLTEANQHEWRFLEELGVHSNINLNFYKLVLQSKIDRGDTSMEEVTEIYRCMAQLVCIPTQEELREFFNARDAIAFFDDRNVLTWRRPNRCRWRGPDFLPALVRLDTHYGGEAAIETFFRTFLGIRDCNHQDVLDELLLMVGGSSDGRTFTLSDTEHMYRFLDENVHADTQWQSIREAFRQRNIVMGDGGRWHTTQTCLWRSPFSLANYQDLSTIYPNLQKFFVNRLGVRNASLSMLIRELRRMAEDHEPRILDIRQRLVDVGRMVARSGINQIVSEALNSLTTVSFLPMKHADGSSQLVGVGDAFAILDHKRYGDAFAEHSILLDFALDESQTLDTLFRHLGLTHRYLSVAVKEVSTVGENLVLNDALTQRLQAQAYSLYCCAAKYKSVKALSGERELFDQLSRAQIYTTDSISSTLCLDLNTRQIRVPSNRPALHHDLCNSQLKVYLPENQRQRRMCFKSQLPCFIASFLGIEAKHSVHLILSSELRELRDTLIAVDIPHVDWIDPPAFVMDSPLEETTGRAPSSATSSSPERFPTPSSTTRAQSTPQPTGRRDRSSAPDYNLPNDDIRHPVPTAPRLYERLIEQVVQGAHRLNNQHRDSPTDALPVRDTPSHDRPPSPLLDHTATFGDREMNEMAHDRRVGAAGELFVFQILSNLNLPGFGRENWRSTIRGEVQTHPQFAGLDNWQGRETADIVYTDRDGALTRYLREQCTGGFPQIIREDRDFTTHPMEYFLEVKTTTSACNSRFYMSSSQYALMETVAARLFLANNRVYVIMRVYNLESRDVGLKIFVDPLRLSGLLDFEVGTWVGKTRV